MILQPLEEAVGEVPPSVGSELHGIAIHWAAPATPPVSPEGQKFRPTLPEWSWHLKIVPFAAVTPDRVDRPPETTVEAERLVRHAFAITAVHHAIPADSRVYYEIGA